MMRFFPVLAAAALGCLALPSHSASAPPQPASAAQQPGAAARHEQGRKIYNYRCYFCHGYSGNAKTLAGSFLEARPRDFTSTAPASLSRERMLDALKNGRPGTGMKSFAGVISEPEMEAVTDFIRQEFMTAKAENTRYHTVENGWPGHREKYGAAFPFATGQIPLDTPWENLSPEQQAGKNLFLSACITCHDRARVLDEGKIWDASAVSYPRSGYSHKHKKKTESQLDGMASATPYARHDVPRRISGLTEVQRRGEKLFLQNCAFCHAADGTGRNWIGSFLQPHPRDLTSPEFMAAMTVERFVQVIRDGLTGTSMPAWKSVLAEDEIRAIIAYVSRAFHPVQGAPS